MAIPEGQFQELEKRFAAFKFVFGRLQTTYGTLGEVNAEPFPTSHQVYLDSLINGKINFANTAVGDDAVTKASRTRTWTIGTYTGTTLDTDTPSSDNLWSGEFTTTIPNPTEAGGYDPGENPNVEKVIIPLIKLDGADNQAYFAYEFQGDEIEAGIITNDFSVDTSLTQYDDTHIAYGSAMSRGDFQDSPYKDRRLRQFIDPVRFGKNYQVELFESSDDRTTFGGKISPVQKSKSNPSKQRGGWIFDYNEGMIYIAPHPSLELPYMAGYKHPLWLVGYRYIGPTGSNMTVTSAGSAGTAGSSGGGGGGVSTTLVSQLEGQSGAYDTNAFGWYDTNTLTATDTEDIIEYRTLTTALIVSASIGEQDLPVRLDSSSYNDITRTDWPFYQANDANIYNGANLFKFGSEITPDYSSYGLFRTTASAIINGTQISYDTQWITQSFQFSSAKRLHQVSLCYSNNDNIDVVNEPQSSARSYYYPAAYKLEGSTDNITFSNLVTVTGIRSNTLQGKVPGPIGLNVNNFGPGLNQAYWPNDVDEQAGNPVRIYCATGSIDNATRYQYYRLYVSGGISGSNDNRENSMALHHFDIWQNLDFGPTNRKQLNIKLNDALVPESAPHFEGPTGQRFTEFDLIVSQSAAKLGLVEFVPPGTSFFDGGNINSDLNFPNNSNIKNVGQISASAISASDSITTGQLNAISMSGVGDGITFNNLINLDTLTTKNLTVQNQFQVNSDVVVPSDKKIFLTNKTQNGDIGTDEFSARIFGNFVEGGGVSDMYLDAYRIYTVSDAKMHMRTLHPLLGSIVLQTVKTHISSSLLIDGPITASSDMLINGNMIISGALLISGSIIPNTSATSKTSSFSLGSSDAAWKDLHLSDGTIRLYDGTQEKATIGLSQLDEIEFKSGNNFQNLKAGTIDFIPPGSTVASVQISDNGRGFIAVSNKGKDATILRAEDSASAALLGSHDAVHGSLTQKGSGSFAIILDAETGISTRPDAKFSIFSNSPFITNANMLFQVSESGETRVHGYLTVSQSINAFNVVATNISANTLSGTFIGAISSSSQIATNISGAFTANSSSFEGRISTVETELGNTLISGSSQLSTEISGAFFNASHSLQNRVAILEIPDITTRALKTEVSGAFTFTSHSLQGRITNIELIDHDTFTLESNFNTLTASVELKANNSVVLPLINATSSYALTSTNVTFNDISASNVNIISTISASKFHTEIFNPNKINTTEFTASNTKIENLSSTRIFNTDNFNTLLSSNTRPQLIVKNEGGPDITYFGNPVNNADAFIKFQADRSNTVFAMGIDSHDGTFKITSGSNLGNNPSIALTDNAITLTGIISIPGISNLSASVAAAVAGGDNLGNHTAITDLNLNSNNIKGVTSLTASSDISASGTIIANTFVGDGSQLSGITTSLPVNLISASAQIATAISGAFVSPFTGTMISGSFTAVSNSLETRLTTVEGATVTLPANLVSSSAQISSNISGAFAEVSNSLQSRIGTLELHDHSTFAVKTAISGAFNGQTGSFLTESPFTAAMISGSFNGVTGSFLTSVPTNVSGLKSLKINGSGTGSLTVGPAARQIELRGGSTFTSTNPRILSSTGIIEVDDAIQMNSHPIYFHEGATNSYIGVDFFTPDNLRIHANQDLYLVPDDNLIISSSTSAKTIHYNELEVIGNVTATSYVGSLTNMTGTIDGGTF